MADVRPRSILAIAPFVVVGLYSAPEFAEDSQICFGPTRCFHPNALPFRGADHWNVYVRPSRHWDEEDHTPFDRCCEACNTVEQCSNSRGEEHLFVSHLLPFINFDAIAQPVFLEIGGVDGVHASNTFFLERCLKWRGVLVEAHPAAAEAMVLNRPGIVTIGSAMCENPGYAPFTWQPGPMATVDVESKFAVPCGKLADYLALLGINHVTFFVLDVEGGELNVLKSIRWDEVTFAVIVVEELGEFNPHGSHAAVRSTLEAQGMMLALSHCWAENVCNAYFVNETFVDMERMRHHAEKVPVHRGSMPIEYGDHCRYRAPFD